MNSRCRATCITLYGAGQLQLAIDKCMRRIVIRSRGNNKSYLIQSGPSLYVTLSIGVHYLPDLQRSTNLEFEPDTFIQRGGSPSDVHLPIRRPCRGCRGCENTKHNEKYEYGRPLLHRVSRRGYEQNSQLRILVVSRTLNGSSVTLEHTNE